MSMCKSRSNGFNDSIVLDNSCLRTSLYFDRIILNVDRHWHAGEVTQTFRMISIILCFTRAGWDGTVWDGMGWDGTGWDGIGGCSLSDTDWIPWAQARLQMQIGHARATRKNVQFCQMLERECPAWDKHDFR